MHLGELEIELISDGTTWVDPGGPFGLVPRALYQDYLAPNADHLVPQCLTCLLVRSQGLNILVDTGLGEKLSDKAAKLWRLQRPGGGLITQLESKGVTPEMIDIVINTHLHADHCGGNTFFEGDAPQPCFPNARYFVQRVEWGEASFPDVRTKATYLAENFQPLLASGRMTLLHGDQEITDHVRCVVAPGHTRGHQVVVLESGDWRGLFVSDLATFAVHFKRTSWVTAFDVEPLENIRTKTLWQRWAVEHDAWLFFIHDTQYPIARLVERDGRYDLDAVEMARPLIDSLPTPQQPSGSSG